MMKFSTSMAAFLVVICVVFAFTVVSAQDNKDAAATELYETEQIRCGVCRRAIDYVWHQGAKLRAHCKSEERNDPRCDFANVHHFGIDEMTAEVCEKLPKTHKAIAGSEFDLVLHESEDAGELHTKENARKIEKVCKAYVHDDKGIDNVALYLFANLDAGKSTNTILHALRHRFCKDACNPHYKLPSHVNEDL